MKKLSKIFALLVALFAVVALAACNTTVEATPEEISTAISYVKEMYKNASSEVSADFSRVGAVSDVTITWTVDVDETKVKVERAETGLTTIKIVDDNPAEDYTFTLTATFTYGEDTKTESWTYTVKKAVPMTWAQLTAAAAEAGLTSDSSKTMTACVNGIVTSVVSKSNGAAYNCLFVETTDGGCFEVYDMTDDPTTLGIEVGMTINVKGALNVYYGQYEFSSDNGNPSVKIVSSEKTPITPENIDALVAAASSAADDALTAKIGKLVTITGVTVKAQDNETTANGYYKFTKGSVESYVRISSSTCAIATADQQAFKDAHNAKVGWKATVTGIVSTYSSKFYLIPVDANAFVYTDEPDLTDEQKVAQSKDILTVTAEVYENGDIALVNSTTLGATVTWASDNAAVVVAEDNSKATVTLPAATTTAKLTATITSGEVTDTKEFTVTLKVFDADIKELTATYLGVGAYKADEYTDVTFQGTTYSYIQVGSYGDGMQMRNKNSVASVLYNKTAFTNSIKCVVLSYNTTKTMKTTTVAALYVEFSTSEDFAAENTNKVELLFEDAVFEYVVSPSVAGEYKYFRISYPTSGYTYAEYWTNINVYTKEVAPTSISLPETLELVLGTDGTLTPTYGPAAAAGSSPELTWTVEDSNVLTVTDGTVHPVTLGTTKVTVALTSNSEVKAECTITVKDLNYGTQEAPLTVSEAYSVIDTLNSAKLYKVIYVTGTVQSYSYNSQYSSYTLYLTDGEKVVQVYSGSLAASVTGSIYNGDTVVAYGYTTVYSGTRELTSYQPEGAEAKVYPTIASFTTATSTISVKEGSESYVSNLSATSGLNGSTFTFTVSVGEGLEIKSVKVNDTAVSAVEGTYTGTVNGNTVIAVEVKQASAGYELIERFDFTSTLTAYTAYNATDMDNFFKGSSSLGEGTKYASHDTTGSATSPLIGANGGSGDSKWSNYNILKLGSTSKASVIKITFAEGTKIAKVTVKATGWTGKNCTLTINGETQSITSHSTGAVEEEFLTYEFEITETNEITITANLCVMISEIEISQSK